MSLVPYLLTGALKGALVTLVVYAADRLFARRMRAAGRRWWWRLIPVAFLVPIHLTLPEAAAASLPASLKAVTPSILSQVGQASFLEHPLAPTAIVSTIGVIWLAGVVLSALGILLPTLRANRTWSQARLSTDHRLLNLLEDAKAVAEVTAPIGLVITNDIPAPALLGWLRPRLLLPQATADDSSPAELKAIFLHELAHFKFLDLPMNWLFALARAVQWFNPLAYLAASGWAQFREEAADEAAIRWLNQPSAQSYGELLLKTLNHCSGGAVPCGALAIGESVHLLKRRMLMIRTYSSKSTRGWLAAAVVLISAAVMAALPAPADEDPAIAAKRDASAAMDTWLTEIDTGDYAKSWADASAGFKKAAPSDMWVSTLNSVRTPLGKLVSRKQVSSLYQTVVPKVGVNLPKGEYVIAQYETSFENLKYAVETVTFKKEDDGVWRAAGYLTKPGQ